MRHGGTLIDLMDVLIPGQAAVSPEDAEAARRYAARAVLRGVLSVDDLREVLKALGLA